MSNNCDCGNRGASRFCIFPECLKAKTGRFGKVQRYNHATQKHITVGDKKIYQRSSWEGNFARALEWHRISYVPFNDAIVLDWYHEPKTFMFDPQAAKEANRRFGSNLTGIKKGTTSYKPDFRVAFCDATEFNFDKGVAKSVDSWVWSEWFEVKGQFKPKDFTKRKRMLQYHKIDVRFIDQQWFDLNIRFYRTRIPEWEIT